jgi:hypothetical protein
MAPITAPPAAPPNPPVILRCAVSDIPAQPVTLMNNTASTKIAKVLMFYSPLLLFFTRPFFSQKSEFGFYRHFSHELGTLLRPGNKQSDRLIPRGLGFKQTNNSFGSSEASAID